MPWREFSVGSAAANGEDLFVFTTAPLRWRPLHPESPDGPQIATLWGDPGDGAFGAVVHLSANVYTLIRRERNGQLSSDA
ncbi:MAG TPA: hypothetical protein VGK31_02755 [Thermoanaerobaculia bacterium]